VLPRALPRRFSSTDSTELLEHESPYFQVFRESAAFIQQHNREPTPEEIGELVDMPAAKVEEILKLGQEPVSLEAPGGRRGGRRSLGDFIEDAATDPSLEIVANRMRDRDLQDVLDKLPRRERRVIELRYGLGDKGPMTLEDIGAEVGVTRERVRQIESKTLAMLKSSGDAAGWRGRRTRGSRRPHDTCDARGSPLPTTNRYSGSCACLDPRSWAGLGQVSDEIGPQMDPATGLCRVAETYETAAFAALS
jgi:Sigma-70, region 4/Sigma-70 region 3